MQVAARGLDIPNVQLVINFDLPKAGQFDSYNHRIGRTGRIGHTGKAISFFTKFDEDCAPTLVEVMLSGEQPVPGWDQIIPHYSKLKF